jgi:hypothetical protein
VDGRWGSRKEANIGRAFILEAGKNNVVGFEVDVVRGSGEFRNGGSGVLEDGVEYVLESIMDPCHDLTFSMSLAFQGCLHH